MTTPDFTSTSGTGISFGSPGDVPIPLPGALGAVAAGIATGIADAGTPDPISVRRRWAVITAINTADSTVDINLGGEIVPHVSFDASYHPALDEVVQVNVVDTDITVIGPTANATYVGYIRRTGQIVVVNRSGTAPGAPTSVNVTLSDAQDPVTILNVPFVSEYFPTVGDQVMLGQGTNTSVYLVLGAVNRTWRRPTGDLEPSLMSVAKPNTLICNGQAVSRATYAALWAWVQLNGLVGSGLPFGAGDGSTTFTLPDFRGRTPIGVGTLGSDTYGLGNTGGTARSVLTTAQMPSHDHNVSVGDHATHDHNVSVGAHATHTHPISIPAHANHDHSVTATSNTVGSHVHGFTTGSSGDHAGHYLGGLNNPGYAVGGTVGYISPTADFGNRGAHTHSGTVAGDGLHFHNIAVDAAAVSGGDHNVINQTAAGPTTHTVGESLAGPTTHSVSETAVGGTTAVDLRAPYLAINWLVWV